MLDMDIVSLMMILSNFLMFEIDKGGDIKKRI